MIRISVIKLDIL